MKIPNRLPYPFPDNIKATIEITDGAISDGHEVTSFTWTGMVNLSQTNKRVQNEDGLWIPLAGQVYIRGDITEGSWLYGITYSGTISFENDPGRYTFSAKKVRNPDGSIHHTYLEVTP